MHEVIESLKKWRDEANRKRVDLKESCEQQNKIKVQKSKLKEELEPIRERLKEICDLEENVGRLNGELSKFSLLNCNMPQNSFISQQYAS